MNGSTLRILDANLNRAREALRVVEDYARFALDDGEICAQLKDLRHQLARATARAAGEAILHRDTPGDVGTDIKVQDEVVRGGVRDVVTAAGKRLGEALRTIEEYLKTIDPAAASRVERVRYRFYDVEMRIERTLRPPGGFDGVALYVLVTESLCAGRSWLEVVEAAIAGGADCLQLREKDLESGELLRRSKQFVQLCRRHSVISIINDRPDIAVLSDADGVHVGQTDLPAIEARKIVGRERIVGVSTHALEQARQAMLDGADYIGVGPVFTSQTKPRPILPGLDFARSAAEAVKIPCIAIAGITAENVEQVMQTGVSGVAVSSAVISAADPRAAAAELKPQVAASRRRKGGIGGTDIPVCVSHSGVTDIPVRDEASPTVHAPASPIVRKAYRNLPHWTLDEATYFITFRTLDTTLTIEERRVVLDHIRNQHGVYYDLIAGVVMPDHGHLILRPLKKTSLQRIMKGTKGVTARLVNKHRGRRGHVWLDESHDRIIRSQRELDEKIQYVYANPVEAGLVKEPHEYPALFVNAPQR